eukprot:GFUD01002599.1.p1 GENE.GFUD01002599.1~~GFUD01002599.1.p1  ORF type:complete len:439 (-),score=161.22 GFUD01002599.1:96-1412(-)
MTKHKKSMVPTPTKGKGSGKGSSKGGGKAENMDLKDCPLDFKQFDPLEGTSAPRFYNVLKRPIGEGDALGLEDLDGLQLELEAMLSNVVVRKRHLKEELDILSNLDKYRGKNRKGPGSPGSKKSGGKDGSSYKKMKLNSGKPFETKSAKPKPDFDPLENEQIKPLVETNKPITPKNETPNRFWAFVEPYCAPLQQEDVKFLEDLIKGYGDMTEYYRVPPLGQHFAIRWAKEDLEAEKTKGGDENKDVKEDVSKILKKEKSEKSDSSPFGELTQRLVQGLMEENLMTQVDDMMVASGKDEDSGSKNSFIQSLKVANGDSLEKRLKKELEEQGILEPGDDDSDAGPDEILTELKRCQEELKAVSQHNLSQLKRLVKSAREEMARQEIRNRLAEADKDVCEAYKRIALSRSKKKSPSKKDKEMAWKSLKDREAILKQLEGV